MLVYGANGNIAYEVSHRRYNDIELEKMEKYSIHVDNKDFEELKKFFFNFKIDYSKKPRQGSFSANINIKEKKITLCENYIYRYREVCFIQNFRYKTKTNFIFKMWVNLLPCLILNKIYR